MSWAIFSMIAVHYDFETTSWLIDWGYTKFLSPCNLQCMLLMSFEFRSWLSEWSKRVWNPTRVIFCPLAAVYKCKWTIAHPVCMQFVKICLFKSFNEIQGFISLFPWSRGVKLDFNTLAIKHNTFFLYQISTFLDFSRSCIAKLGRFQPLWLLSLATVDSNYWLQKIDVIGRVAKLM